MGKLRRLSGREVCGILERHGFVHVRQWGSHMIMQMATGAGTTTVPVPDHPELRIGTLRAIIRQSGLYRDEFESRATLLTRRQTAPNEGLTDWLLACPEKGYFVPIESESTDTL